MEPSFSLKVLDLKGAVRTVENILWNTTSKEFLERLLPSTPISNGISLVEFWHESFKRIPMDKTLSSVIREWGYIHLSSDDVRLAIMRNPKWRYDHPYMCKRRKYAHVRDKRRFKRKYRIGKSKVSMMNAIGNVTRQILDEKQKLEDLIDPACIHESPAGTVQQLPRSKQEQGKALFEAIEEEDKEKKALLKRKNELSEKNKSKEKALEKAKKRVSDLNAQVLNEQYKLKTLKESRNAPEVEQITKEISKVKEEIAVRMRLNKLQLSKMNELTEAVLQAEEDLKDHDRELEVLYKVA